MRAQDALLVDAIVDAVHRLQPRQAVVLGDIAVLTDVKSRNRIHRLMPAAVARSTILYPGQRLVVTSANTYEITDEFTWRTMRHGVARGRSALRKLDRLGHEAAVDHPVAAIMRGLIVAAEGLRTAFDAAAELIPPSDTVTAAAAALNQFIDKPPTGE